MENTPGPIRPAFMDFMRPGERIAALVYLPVHIFALPTLLPYLAAVFPDMNALDMNVLYYIIGFVYILTLCWRFLRRSFDTVLDAPGRFFLSVVSGYAMDFMLSLLLSYALIIFGLTITSPNNEAITGMAPLGYNRLVAISVFLAPIVEEVLFRGLVFGALAARHRAAAWIVSVLVFSVYHVWQFAVSSGSLLVLISAALYVPSSLAFNWCYERSGTIWAPIALHMLSNAISLSVTM